MKQILEAILLGIVQGITEFLPVSSSGHLELAKRFFDIELHSDLSFTVAVHVATVFATLIVFRKKIIRIIRDLVAQGETGKSTRKYVGYLLISVIPLLVIGTILDTEIANLFEQNLFIVGGGLLLTSLLLFSISFLQTQQRDMRNWKALVIGLAQTIAIVPGVSRSGATTATALNLGINKKETAEFVFLMPIIPILGAAVLSSITIISEGHTIDWAVFISGFSAAFIAGLIGCKAMIRIIQSSSLKPFAIYCAVIGAGGILFEIIT